MGFLGGAFGGFAKETTAMRDKGKRGLLRRKKKTTPVAPAAEPDDYRRGGKVRKGGMARLEKGERVLTKRQAARRSKRR